MPKSKGRDRTKSQSRWEQEKMLAELQQAKEKRQGDGDRKITAVEMQQQLMDETKLQRAKDNQPKYVRTDARFKEIREELARRNRRKQEDDIVEEFYVDSYRMVAVQLSDTFTDLKNIIQKSGMKFAMGEQGGEQPDVTFAKTAHYFMGKYDYKNALFYVNLAMDLNPESVKARHAAARIHSLVGNWSLARESAEWILKTDKNNVKAILIKAESLFNCCQFEHALLLFHRGQKLAPEDDEFRLGIQKCHKTIKDSVRDERVFKREGVDLLFKILRKTAELRSSDIAKYRYEGRDKANTMGFSQIFKMLKEKGELGDEEQDDDVFQVKKAEAEKKTFQKLKKSIKKGNTSFREEDIVVDNREKNLAQKLKAQQDEIDKQAHEKQAKVFAKQKKQARETRVFVKRAIKQEKTKAKGNVTRQKKNIVADRLFEDKVYLAVLARGINLKKSNALAGGNSNVESKIATEAEGALAYLRSREDFWDQIELGKDHLKPARVCESFRFLM